MHSRKVAHTEVRVTNVLLTEDGIKLWALPTLMAKARGREYPSDPANIQKQDSLQLGQLLLQLTTLNLRPGMVEDEIENLRSSYSMAWLQLIYDLLTPNAE